jgi:sulfur relay (sulfurtransferase) complex TusBCD TusD component (DsrE family)
MARYLLIESRDPFESRDVPYYYGLANDLAAQGDEVTLFLVQNGVLAARKAAPDNPLATLVTGAEGGKVQVLADGYSLRERGIVDGETLDGVSAGDIDQLVTLAMADGGTKVMWH